MCTLRVPMASGTADDWANRQLCLEGHYRSLPAFQNDCAHQPCNLLQAAAEYFRLMLPPWDAQGSCKGWVKLAVRL